jgi:hypothetical protein
MTPSGFPTAAGKIILSGFSDFMEKQLPFVNGPGKFPLGMNIWHNGQNNITKMFLWFLPPYAMKR